MFTMKDILDSLEEQRAEANMRVRFEDRQPDRPEYYFAYYEGLANGLDRAIEEIKTTKRPKRGRKRAPELHLI